MPTVSVKAKKTSGRHKKREGEANTINVLIGERVRTVRKALGKTQTEVAVQVDISFQMLQKHESGATPIPIDRLFLLAQVLGTSVAELLPLDIGKASDAGAFRMNSEERELLKTFRALPSGSFRTEVTHFLTKILDQVHA